MALPLPKLAVKDQEYKESVVGPSSPTVDTPLPPGQIMNPEAALELLFNTIVGYGGTGSRKTSQGGEFAKYIYETTGKQTRMITMDGGGYGPVQDLVNAGIIDVWRLVEEENPKVALIKASKGAWPQKLHNGLRMSQTIAEPMRNQRSVALKDIGGYIVEGWSSIAKAIMRDAVAKGQKISEDVVSKFTETSDLGSESFGAPSRAHYGFAQNFMLDFIRNFSGLPISRIFYTALEGKGEDRLTKQLQYGPEVAGQAITASIPQYVGDCLHFEDFQEEKGTDPNNPKQKLIEPGVRVWFTNHPDQQTGVIWPAKCRLLPSKIEEFKSKMGQYGYFVLGKSHNLNTYLHVQDELLASGSNEAREWKARIDAQRAEREKGSK